jgi:dolichyl-phosphate-mannose-protein mannosyltransferase
MVSEPPARRPLVGLLGLAAVLVAGLGLRLWALGLDGHSGDVLIIHRWAERLAEVGSWNFYEGQLAVYPAMLYLYWPMGLLFDGEVLDLVIKGSSIPFDLAIGLVLWLVVRRPAGDLAAVAACALFLLNPAVIIAGPMWGQIDAAGTLFMLGALIAIAGKRWATAGSLTVLAGLAKPQFGLVVLLLAVAVFQAVRHERRLRPAARSAVGAIATYALIAAPLALDPIRYADQLGSIALYKPMTSLFAFNPWGLFIGFEKPDGNLVFVGGVLLLGGLLASAAPIWRRQDLAILLAAGALVIFAIYFLPTRAHERYLFPAVALLAPFAATSWRGFLAYVALSAAFAASLLYALSFINRAALTPELYDALRAPPTVWAIGLTLMAAALAWVWLLVRGTGAQRLDAPARARGSVRSRLA